MAKNFAKKTVDTHHICWTRKSWSKPYAKELRSIFTHETPLDLHHYIHAKIQTIPVPSETACRVALGVLGGTDVSEHSLLDKIAWLAENVPDWDFQLAMWRQYSVVENYKTPRFRGV